jgi:GTP-binding protein HflX
MDACLIVLPHIGQAAPPSIHRREETLGLVQALDLEALETLEVRVRKPTPGQLFGTGQVEMLADAIARTGAGVLVIDSLVSAIQQRNLERATKAKVIDRTGLILEIFGLRARTREGRIQVEMARLLYERSRLVRTWTHLERQRGGFGFLGGPGETQLEADRRMLDNRIDRYKREIADIRRTRGLQRAGRKRRDVPVIGLVGYTNAGKSTLFNRIAGSDVFAANMPFATLDPTIRQVRLPSGRSAALVDTVGFISDLPTHLVAAFSATLEEALEADVLIHVRDMAHPETQTQRTDVEDVLKRLEAEAEQTRPPMIEAWNKADLLDHEDLDLLVTSARERPPGEAPASLVSALTGEGVAALLALAEDALLADSAQISLKVEPREGQLRAWIIERARTVREEALEAGHMLIEAELSLADASRLQARLARNPA